MKKRDGKLRQKRGSEEERVEARQTRQPVEWGLRRGKKEGFL